MRDAQRMATGLRILAYAAVLCALAVPAQAQWNCAGSRCIWLHHAPMPKAYRGSHAKRWCAAPPGFGWYRRQKLDQDNKPPFAVSDELRLDGPIGFW